MLLKAEFCGFRECELPKFNKSKLHCKFTCSVNTPNSQRLTCTTWFHRLPVKGAELLTKTHTIPLTQDLNRIISADISQI